MPSLKESPAATYSGEVVIVLHGNLLKFLIKRREMRKGWTRQHGCHCHLCACGGPGQVPIQDHGGCGGVAPSPTGFSGSFVKCQIQSESDWFVQRLYLPGDNIIIII